MSSSRLDQMAPPLSPQRLKLLKLLEEKLKQEGGLRPAAAVAVQPWMPEKPFPLTQGQRGLWLSEQAAKGVDYNIPSTARLVGQLTPRALAAAITHICDRHQILRTVYRLEEGEPVQVVLPSVRTRLPTIDLGGLPGSQRGMLAQALAERELGRGFCLEEGPVLRALLLRFELDEHWLILTVHHIAADRWSMGILLRDLALAYWRQVEPAYAPPAEASPGQFADFARWQQHELRGARLEALVARWKRRLEGVPPVLELPLDHPRPSVPRSRAGRRTVVLAAAVKKDLERLSQRLDVSLYTVLLAAFQGFLQRISGLRHITLGTPVAGRQRSEFKGVVGFLANTVALSQRLHAATTFEDLVRQTGRTVKEALADQDLPFFNLAQALHPAVAPGCHPIYQVMFAFRDLALPVPSLPGLKVEILDEVHPVGTPVDLTLVLTPKEKQLIATWEFRCELFEGATIERWARLFVPWVEALLAAPSLAMGRVSLLSPEQERDLLEVGRAEILEPSQEVLPEALSRVARRQPAAVAVDDEAEPLTYRVLEERAEALARRLRALGCGPEVPIAVRLAPSANLVVALVGVLKAGGAYLPVDPEAPQQRLAFLLETTGAGALVGCGGRPEGVAVPYLDLLDPPERDEELGRGLASAALSDGRGAAAENLAYLIFTSGSTGVPKAVGVSHEVAVAHFRAWGRVQGFTPQDRVCLFSTPSFDVSVEQILAPLLAGATLVPRPPELLSAEEFVGWLERRALSVLSLPPSYWSQLVPAWEANPNAGRSLRRVNPGGDVLPPQAVRRFREALPEARLVNGYGPTETVVTAACYHLEGSPSSLAEAGSAAYSEEITQRIPIGRPLPGRRLYVLDRQGELLPFGVPGELAVGGGLLSRGYAGSPAVTAARFVPDPCAGQTGARRYLTGDRARWLACGNLDFLGRADLQVKIRGFRIELGEVEAALCRVEGVAEAAVLRCSSKGSEDRLGAYVAVGDGPALAPESVRGQLGRWLPSYMLPSYLVCLESLPRTASGKVDRRALPQPSADSPRAELDHPRTPVEALLADLWQEALGRPVGIHENFFQLGGDSILSLGIVSKAARAGFALRPGSFFSHPTIAELASVVETSEQKPAADAVRDALWPAPLTPIQSWFFEQDFAWPQHWNQAVFLELGEAPGVRLLEQALDLLMRHHEALRLRFRQEGGRWLQQPEAVGSAPPLLVVDLAALEGDHRRLSEVAVCNRTQRSLEIGRGPVFRVVLFQGSPARLLLVAHHLVVDGVSWRILLEDLASLLGQLAAGAEPSLPAATASLGQWTRGLEALLEAGKLDDDLAYWQKACRRKVESLLPDDPAGDATGASAVTLSRRLDEITTSSLLGPALKPYRSRVDELLLTALALAVRAQEGSSGLLVEVEGHGREDLVAGLDLSRTVGWLTSRFPLLVELTGSAAFGSEGGEEAGETPLSAFMIAVKEGLRRVPQRGASFGVLRYLAAQEATGVALRQGQPPTLTFNYLGQAAGSLDGWPARFLPWQAGAECGPENRLPAEIEVLAMVVDGSLELRWTFSRQRFDVGRMERLIGAFATAIGQVVSHCLGLEQPVPTPSDYPLAGISLSRLRALSESFGSPEDLYPVSPVQAGMLFHTLHRPGEGQYIEQLICDLLGPLNLETFRQAWAQVLSHHSVLRTAFLWRDLESPLQAVAQAVSLPLQLLDWSALDEAEASAEERALLRRDRARGFDLAAPPLLRLTLIRRGQERHRLLWTVHHLLLDGGSEPVVLREVFTLYRARLAGRAVELAVRRPFRDYIAWLEDQDREADRSFWREALQGFAEPNRLPSGEGEGDGGFEHREEQLFLSATVTAGLLTSCRQAGLTPSIPIQAAWALVLADLCQQEDVVFGLTLSGRPPQLAGAEEMVGMFLNTLPCRVRLSRGEDLVSWLGRLHQSTAELLRHGSSSLAEIQAANGVTPGAGLFETIVVFMNQPRGLDLAALAAAGGLKVDRVEGVEQTNYPLTLTAFAEQRLLLQINYRVGRFSDSFCRSLLRALEGILSRWSESFAGTVGEARSALEQETRRRAQEQTQQVRQLRQRVLGRLRPRGAASGRVPLVMPASSMEEIL